MTKNKKRTTKIIATKRADRNHAVHTIKGGNRLYRREPCQNCPWRKDAVGVFPAEAFRISAVTGADGSLVLNEADMERALHGFACHSSGAEKPAMCAGYILRSEDAIGWRLGVLVGAFDPEQVSDGGHTLFENYREMAEANGVAPDDPALRMIPRCKIRT